MGLDSQRVELAEKDRYVLPDPKPELLGLKTENKTSSGYTDPSKLIRPVNGNGPAGTSERTSGYTESSQFIKSASGYSDSSHFINPVKSAKRSTVPANTSESLPFVIPQTNSSSAAEVKQSSSGYVDSSRFIRADVLHNPDVSKDIRKEEEFKMKQSVTNSEVPTAIVTNSKKSIMQFNNNPDHKNGYITMREIKSKEPETV